MALSRHLAQKQICSLRLCTINFSVRPSSHVAIKQESDVSVRPQDMDKPSFFQRVALRWQGIPLKGEEHAPISGFRDCDKLFYPEVQLDKVSKDYKEHPERDLVNYPYPEKELFPPKTRFFLIPNAWLTPIEKVTGTSGPYVLIGGLVAFLINKEYVPLDEHLMKLQAFGLIYFIVSRTAGFRIDKFFYNMYLKRVEQLKGLVDAELKDAVEFRKSSAAETESLKAVQEKFPVIFKENLALQLEATYRRNVESAANELKRRIDYLQEVEDTKLRFERDILLKSIIQGVQNQIMSNEGNIKDAFLDNCIVQLKTLPT